MRILVLSLIILSGCDRTTKSTELDLLVIKRTAASVSDATQNACDKVLPNTINFVDEGVLNTIKNLPASTYRCFSHLALDLQNNLAELISNATLVNADKKSIQDNTYDVAIIGGGAASAVFSRNFLQTNPDAKIIIIERNSNIFSPQFATDSYLINSPEPVGPPPPSASANIFPNAPVQISDFKQNLRFVPARAIWNEIVLTQFFTTAHVVMGLPVKKITRESINNTDLYKIQLSNSYVIAEKIVVATGLGESSLPPSSDDVYLLAKNDKIRCIQEVCLPRLMSIDDLIWFDNLFKQRKKNIFDQFKDKTIAVVGAHDGGFIAVEFLSQLAPSEAYLDYQAPKKIDWFNTYVNTYDEFKNSADIKPRYKLFPRVQPLYKGIFDNQIFNTTKGVINYELFLKQKVAVISIADDKITISTDSTGQRHYDYVISAVGYENNVKTLLKDFLGENDKGKNIDELCPRVSVKNKTAALKCAFNQEQHEIYIIGTAAPKLATQEDLDASITKNAHSFNVLNPITERFAREYLRR